MLLRGTFFQSYLAVEAACMANVVAHGFRCVVIGSDRSRNDSSTQTIMACTDHHLPFFHICSLRILRHAMGKLLPSSLGIRSPIQPSYQNLHRQMDRAPWRVYQPGDPENTARRNLFSLHQWGIRIEFHRADSPGGL
jgi:hypothetical protein